MLIEIEEVDRSLSIRDRPEPSMVIEIDAQKTNLKDGTMRPMCNTLNLTLQNLKYQVLNKVPCAPCVVACSKSQLLAAGMSGKGGGGTGVGFRT